MKNILYTLALLLIPAYSFAEEPLQEKIQRILNDKTVDDPYERWAAANDTVCSKSYLPFEEAMLLYDDILNFVEKNVKDKRKYNSAKALCYINIGWVYEIRGDPGDYVTAEIFMKKAIECAELSGDDARRARVYYCYGRVQSILGNISLAHEYFYKAINLYEALNDYKGIFTCLYLIAENLLHTRDIAGLGKVVKQMEQNLENPACNTPIGCLYDFYQVQSAYYSIQFEDNPEITAYNDSTLMATRNTIILIENNPGRLGETPAIGFAYHNMSLAYRRCYPDRYDSIYYFLDKALEFRSHEKMVDLELELCVYISYAELHFEQKRYAQAERDMLYALSLLEQVEDDNVTTEYAEAYKFLVMYYETMNRPSEALKYHKLLLENEKRRYDNDKIVAMDDMLVKYETEKKIEQIDRLAAENKMARNVLLLTIGLILVLLAGVLILIHVLRLRKKNYELSIYESALLAELKQTELEQFKQQIEQKATKNLMERLTTRILESTIEGAKKDLYIQQMSELDADALEQSLLTISENISKMDIKYILCFAIDMDVKDMGLLFNVEPASIRSVRYRIKKKFGEKNIFRFLM